VSDGVLRAAGLSAITDAGRQGHGLTTFIYATMVRDKAFAELEAPWRAALERYRIGEKEWDAIRSAATEKLDNGLDLLTPASLGDGEHKTASSKWRTTSRISRSRCRTSRRDPCCRSTPARAPHRRAAALWPADVSDFHDLFAAAPRRPHGRAVERRLESSATRSRSWSRPRSWACSRSSSTRSPTAAIPSRWIRQRPKAARLGGRELLKGGGVGILGDIAGLTAQGRYMSAAEYAAGPLPGDADRLLSGLHGAATGKPRAPAKLAQLAKENVPGNNVWYARLVLDRLLADQIQRSIDPTYDDQVRGMQRRAAEHGQGFLLAPGETAPSRAPNLMNAIEGERVNDA
jgi:hypothetical protein